MSDTRVKQHPTLGILVGTDGHVLIPANGKNKAHWTFGSKHNLGYRQVRIDGKHYYVHRLVVEAFIQYPIPEGYQIDHINRDKSANFLSNLRIVTPSQNSRNTYDHDRVDARNGTHIYEDERQYMREHRARYRAEHPEKVREQKAQYSAKNKGKIQAYHSRYRAENKDRIQEYQASHYQAKRKTHRRVQFSDGRQRWIPLADAEALFKIPVKERIFKG